jgi:hypothetical protein
MTVFQSFGAVVLVLISIILLPLNKDHGPRHIG